MSISKKIFRHEFLIYPRFQLLLVVANCAVMMGLAWYLGSSAKASFAKIKYVGTQIHLSPSHPFFKLVETEAHNFYSHLILALAVSIFLSSWIILKTSHKVVGPLFQLRDYFQKIVRREKAPRKALRFRDSDCFEDLPGMVNGAIGILRSGVEEEETTSVNIPKY